MREKVPERRDSKQKGKRWKGERVKVHSTFSNRVTHVDQSIR